MKGWLCSCGGDVNVPVVPCDNAALFSEAPQMINWLLCEYVNAYSGIPVKWNQKEYDLADSIRGRLESAAGATSDQSTWPAHLRDDAPFKTCDTCGRKTWATEARVGDPCAMPQPSGVPCEGHFGEAVTVPVVPCDDAAVDRAAYALACLGNCGLPWAEISERDRQGWRTRAQAVLRAAGETP